MYEATVCVKGGGPYEAATADGETTISLWCTDHCDLLAVRGPARERALAPVREKVGVRERVEREGETLVVTADCLKRGETDTIETYLAAHGCLAVPPLRYANGAKECRVLALDGDSLSAFYRDVSEDFPVEVVRKREAEAVAFEDGGSTHEGLLGSLSARQREVFRTAHRMGYYEIPREASTEEIADAMDLSRRTVGEHLQRAEKKLADAVVEGVAPDL